MKNFILVLLATLCLASCGNAPQEQKIETVVESEEVKVQEQGAIKSMTYNEFKEEVYDFESSTGFIYSGDTPMIIDFYADWCQPCKMLSPILEELNEEAKGKIIFRKVNIDEELSLASAFNVKSIPALLVIPTGGKEPLMSVGLMKKEELRDFCKKFLKVKF